MIKIRNLKKFFGGVKAVNDCSFMVEKNKITALIGPNGSGKTTVFNLISGIIKPDSGQIIFDGENIIGKSVDAISNIGVSRVFQQTYLFKNLTVKENLLLALDNQDTFFWKNMFGLNRITEEKEEKIKNILKILNIFNTINHKAENLSFGQKRLVELGRAILNPHKMLMLDEPVAGVTLFLKKKIKNILLSLKEKGETILLIEHDIGFVFDIADTVIVLDSGKIIAKDVPQKIKNNPKVLEAYFGE